MSLIDSEGGGGSSSSSTNLSEEDPVTTSVLTYSKPSATSMQFDGRASTYNNTEVGALQGTHTYLFNTLRNYLDPNAVGVPVPLTAGANVTFDGVDTFTKSIAGNSWNSWFQSTDAIVNPVAEDIKITWLIEDDFDNDGDDGTTGTIREMAGLDDNPSANASYSSIDYAIYQVNATTVYIYERGSNKGSFARPMNVNDRLGIKVESGVVTYIHVSAAGYETEIFTSEKRATNVLFFKGAINRGVGQSGHGSIGGVLKHSDTIQIPVTAKIVGTAQAVIHPTDIERLTEVGLEVVPSSVYSLVSANQVVSDRFPAGTTYDVTHGFSMTLSQTTITTT